MPAFEIHTETYEVEDIEVIEAKDAYEAALTFAQRFAPCSVRRTHPERDGDTFLIVDRRSTGWPQGVDIEVFEHDPTAEPWS